MDKVKIASMVISGVSVVVGLASNWLEAKNQEKQAADIAKMVVEMMNQKK